MGDWSNECWELRLRSRLTQSEAAAACFVAARTWRRWEAGRTEPPCHVKEDVRKSMHREQIAYLGARLAAATSSSRSRPRAER